MSKLIKRKDGSYSKRGLWDNIRANKGSGKKPTKDMLKQESKIKKEENMKSMYKAGGKNSKSKMKKPMPSFMEESKEMEFGAPGVKPPMKKMMGGGVETGMEVNARMNQAMGKANMAGKKMMGGKYENGGPAGTTKSRTVETNPTGTYKTITKTKSVNTPEEQSNSVKTKTRRTIKGALKDAGEDFKYNLDSVLDELEERKEARKNKKSVVEGAGKGAASTMKKGGFPDLNKDGKTSFADVLEGRLKGKEKMMGGKYKEGGAMSKFKTMAAAGKKKMGGKKC